MIDEGKLNTMTYRKPTSSNSLLHWGSYHSTPLKCGIPRGQYLRIKRNCSQEISYSRQARDLRNHFQDRGYPVGVLKDVHKHALHSKRHDLLSPRKKDNDNLIRLIGIFDHEVSNVRKIFDQYWSILLSDQDINTYLPTRAGITFRRGCSIRDQLVHSHYQPPASDGTWLSRKINGVFRCGQCKTCPFIVKTKTFASIVTNEQFEVRDFINCKSKGIVYMIKCTCPKNYVGKTKWEFRRRVLDHIGDIHHRRETSVSTHVWELHNGDLRSIEFYALEMVRQSPRGGDWDLRIL